VGIVTNEALIKFSLPSGMVISLDIYDNTGRLVKNLVNGKVSAGLHTVRWNANVANGVYFYRLKAGDSRVSDKMVVIR
jgi:flagellar hook assembly protein FlgD